MFWCINFNFSKTSELRSGFPSKSMKSRRIQHFTTLKSLVREVLVQQGRYGHYMTPTQTLYFDRQIPQNHHTFAFFDPPPIWVPFKDPLDYGSGPYDHVLLSDLRSSTLKRRSCFTEGTWVNKRNERTKLVNKGKLAYPRESKNQTLPIGSGESFICIILSLFGLGLPGIRLVEEILLIGTLWWTNIAMEN